MADKETDISWALKLLTSEPELETSILGRYSGTIIASVTGFLAALYVNHASRKPLWSGIQKHVTFPILFGGLARLYEIQIPKQTGQRDAMYRHYITLHPEDFPEPERKKIGEVLKPWTPIR